MITLVASAKLHGLDPEPYRRDIIRVFPHWDGAPWFVLAPRTRPRPASSSASISSPPSSASVNVVVPAEFPHLSCKTEEQRAAD